MFVYISYARYAHTYIYGHTFCTWARCMIFQLKTEFVHISSSLDYLAPPVRKLINPKPINSKVSVMGICLHSS